MDNNGEIILYQSEDSTQIEVRIEEDTVWLTQAQMVNLFLSTKQNVSLHINNIFKEAELDKDSVVKYSLTTANDGKAYSTNFYNLDVIISVGYRVKSKRGTQINIKFLLMSSLQKIRRTQRTRKTTNKRKSIN